LPGTTGIFKEKTQKKPATWHTTRVLLPGTTRILKKKHTEKKTSYLVHDESLIAGYYELVRVGVVVVYGLERSL